MNRLRVIAVTSGKGGVGKSSVSVNLAVLAAKAGRRVLLLDADLGLANAEVLLGIAPKHHLGDLLAMRVEPIDALSEGPHGLKILSAGSGVQGLTHLDQLERMRLIGALDRLEDHFDLVVIDSPAGIGDNVIFFVGAAQETILVITPEPTSLTDAYAAVKVLSAQAGVRRFDVLVNLAPNEAAGRDVFDKLQRVTNRFLQVELRWLGFVPRDENLHRAVMAQRPLVEHLPLSPASRALSSIGSAYLAAQPQARLGGGLKLLWQRLLLESAGG